ncbi:MAG: hypothetical protein ACLGIG_12775 [Actinomycetes bacterium]
MTDTLLSPEPVTPTQSSTDRPTARALDLLAAGVPLSLLLDLAAAVPSRDLLAAEPGDTGWVPRAVA